MKIINAPDIHCPDRRVKPEWHDKAIASLTTLAEKVERVRPALVTIPGDLYHGGIQNSEAAGFPAFLRLIRRILDVCPIAAVTGTGSHDPWGSYKALTTLKAEHPFILLDPAEMSPPVAWLRADGHMAVELWSDTAPAGEGEDGKPKLMILGLPEPTREWLLASSESASAEETSEKMKTALRGILLGFGALRARYPGVPCVFLGHFPVAGASMQNGQIVGAGEITLGREDLQLIAPDITARYGGNAYPKEWGELGQAGFDIIDLQPGDTFAALGHIHLAQEVVHGREIAVTRVDYPHPRRVKFTLDWPEPVGGDVEGVQAWICYQATKEQAAKIDIAAVLSFYLDPSQGALKGSKVTVETINTETVRAPEITEKRRLAEKLQVLEEASSMPILLTASTLAKADQLEREAAERGAAAGMHFRLRRLRLRGAIGTWKGLHQDEIDIDLDQRDPGLIALVGVNGAGKSTLIENMHPYPCMLTRDGKLQDHFRLRDSARELWFVDERTGTEYRALMEIDGANSSGSVKYHLFRMGRDEDGDADEWEPVNDGAKLTKDDYEQAIERLIGSLPLFLRSAFVSQRPTKSNPDLSEATKGEKKAIFRELAGLDYIQAYAESAKQKAAAIEAEISVERGRIAEVESQLAALPGLQDNRAQKAADLSAKSDEQARLAEKGAALKVAADALAETLSEQRALAERIAGLEDQLAQQQQIILANADLIVGYRNAVEYRQLAEKIIADFDALKEQENAETKRLSEVNAERARLQGEYNARLKTHHDDVRKVEADRAALRTKSASLDGDRNVLRAKIGHLEVELKLPLTDTCPTCKQHLPAEMLSILKQKRAESEAKLADLKQKHEEAGRQFIALGAQLAAITLPPDLPALELPPVDQAPLQRIRNAIASLDVVAARKTLTTAQEAATRTEEAKKRQAEAEAEVTRLSGEIFAAQSEQDATVEPAYQEALAKLEAAREEYGQAQRAIAGLEGEIKGLDARICELQALEHNLGDRKVTLEERTCEAAEWAYLSQACGPDGIQALELDALGPGIAETTNRILSAAYGNRFAVEFRTTRIGGKGAKAHQIEDFLIWIIDSELGTEQEISTLSGGEAVWIKNALYAAFGIIRERSTGIKFLTCFLDEMDGALDPEARLKYFDMLQAVHQESGRHHTLIITHSESAQEMIPQHIVMKRSEASNVA